MINKAIILAAGYAKRLFPLTENFPKPLLEIEPNKPTINYIIKKIENTKEIKIVYVITNNKYYKHFKNWKKNLKTSLSIEIINDLTNSEETKLGAVGDINFVINKKQIQEPILIIGGDNLFDFELKPILNYFKKINKDLTTLSEEKDIERLKKLNSIKLDENNKIIFFEEKPLKPTSILYGNCIYIYKKETLELINQFLEQGNNPDQPGRFLQWLYQRKEVYGYISKSLVFDIGNLESLEKARKQKTL